MAVGLCVKQPPDWPLCLGKERICGKPERSELETVNINYSVLFLRELVEHGNINKDVFSVM
jgi:hypothetical protein